MPNNNHLPPLVRLYKAAGYSWKGLRSTFKHEQAFRQELAVLVLVVPLGLWLGTSGLECALLIGSWLLVIIVEILNSSIEAVVDRVGTERHKLAGRAKDMGSAAVLVAILFALVIWLGILLDHYWIMG
jgi:diacylglycerol kinase (ATP)